MELEQTRLFVKVVQYGGFTKAGAALRIPKSTISKAVTKLEKETGSKLLVRNTRNQTLTAAGRLFYETCLGPIQTLEEAKKSLHGKDNIISGKVKITAPEDIGIHIIAPIVAKMCLKYSMLTFELEYSNELIDLVREGFDLAVRIGELDESSLKQRKIGYIEMIPVASPGYVKAKGKVSSPKELESLDCLALSNDPSSDEWALKKEKQLIRVKVVPRVLCNQMSTLIRIAEAGGGVAFVPKYLCYKKITEGKLVHVLPEWRHIGYLVSMVSPLSMSSLSKLNLVANEIVEALREDLARK